MKRAQNFKTAPITFEETNNTFLIEGLLNLPKLKALRRGISPTSEEHEPVQFGHKYILVKKANRIVGVINYNALNERTLNIHLNILPEYWKKNISIEVAKEFKNILANTKQIRKVITTIPTQARHATIYAKRIGMIKEGTLTQACTYNGITDDLQIFSLIITP